MNERWTIEQLAPLVERALDLSGYDGQHSGRVRGLPNLRTIRYYTTLGLLDPPAEMRGRKAYYGRRHLVQLVAVKRLQSRGLSLAQVQQALAGIDDLALAELASLPADFWDRAATQVGPGHRGAAQHRQGSATPFGPRSPRWLRTRTSRTWSLTANLLPTRKTACAAPGPAFACARRSATSP